MIESTYLILLVHGPNLNLLGERNPEVYGNTSLAEIESNVLNEAKKRGAEIKTFQSNHEGEIIDVLHDERHWANGILINAGAYSHYSYAIRDAIEAINIPTIEIHLSNIQTRETFRKKSVLSSVCLDTVSGLGKNSYLEGLKILITKQ